MLSVRNMLQKHVAWAFSYLHRTLQTGRQIVLRQTVLFTGPVITLNMNSKEQKTPETRDFSVPLGTKCSPPLYCRPPPLHLGSPASQVQGGSQAEESREGKTFNYSNIKYKTSNHRIVKPKVTVNGPVMAIPSCFSKQLHTVYIQCFLSG